MMRRILTTILTILTSCMVANHANAAWTAYNDTAWKADDIEGVTGYFTTNNPLTHPSGSLITEAGVTLTNVTVSMTTNLSTIAYSTSIGTNTSPWYAGTDAANEFAGKIGRGYLLELQGTNPLAMVTVSLAGLDATKQYKLVVWCSRVGENGASYSNRYTDVILSGIIRAQTGLSCST